MASFWVTMVIFKGKNVTEPTLVPPSRITWIIRLRKHRHLQQLALANVLSVTSIKCLPTPSLSHTMNIDLSYNTCLMDVKGTDGVEET